jgi:hypothetical protein
MACSLLKKDMEAAGEPISADASTHWKPFTGET